MNTPIHTEQAVFGIDLGSTCGIARGDRYDGAAVGGVTARSIVLCPEKRLRASGKAQLRGQDPRVVEFARTLDIELGSVPSTSTALVVFEDVQFAKSLAQAQLWASFRGALWAHYAHYSSIAAVPTGTLKLFATGRGDASKDEMAHAAVARWGARSVSGWDDNAIDAAWLVAYGLDKL